MLHRYTTVLPGIDTLFAGLWPGRTALQQHLCNNSNGVVAIVQRGKEFLIRGKIPPVVPLQMAREQIQRIALSDAIRHHGGLHILVRGRLWRGPFSVGTNLGLLVIAFRLADCDGPLTAI